MYAVQVTVTIPETGGWKRTKQLPTFYLDENVQGIVNNEHACRIAYGIVNPCDETNKEFSISAEKI